MNKSDRTPNNLLLPTNRRCSTTRAANRAEIHDALDRDYGRYGFLPLSSITLISNSTISYFTVKHLTPANVV